MAVTVLKHLKESKKGNPAAHLKHAIKYILNPEKTCGGTLIGGNCGTEAAVIYDAMIDVKKEYGKEWGRQGYHFVISFQPGECNDITALQIGKEFCEKYLGDGYQYVYSVHNDHVHKHVHIVFNSVSQISGEKYRYENGDWEKTIQPITDALCQSHELQTLHYDRNHLRGKSYTEHIAEKNEKVTWKTIIRADIDFAISQVHSMDEFYLRMAGMGYQIRIGYSEKRQCEYLSIQAPGAARARRDYNLGDGYSLAAIKTRIIHQISFETQNLPADLNLKCKTLSYIRFGRLSPLQQNSLRRVRQAMDWHAYAFQMAEQKRVRKDLIQMDKIYEQCIYLMDRPFESLDEVKDQLMLVKMEIKRLRSLDLTMDTEAQIQFEKLKKERRLLTGIIKEFDLILTLRDVPQSEVLSVIPLPDENLNLQT